MRIIIIGVAGSGKTTLGRNLSAKLNIPAIDLDEIHWLPDWQTRALEDSRRMVDEATRKPAWTISGNYSRLQDIFFPRANMLVWLDYPFLLVFWRLLRRSVLRIVDRQSVCNGNYEAWSKFFSTDSIMVWFFKSFRKRKQTGRDIFEHPDQYPHLKLVRLRHPKETAAWLEGFHG